MHTRWGKIDQAGWFAACLAVLVLAAAAPATAQVLYGSLVGTVEDPTGAVIPGARVTIVNERIDQTRTTTTGAEGSFNFSNLPAGAYTLRVEAEGFNAYRQENITVSANAVRRVAAVVEVGPVTETVTVAASRVALQTDKTDVRTELDSQEINNLPLPNYRNYQKLIDLVPGATPAQFQNAVTDTPARALTTNVNGVNRNNNTTRVDGAPNIFIWLPHHTAYVPPSETIETVNISTNNFDAEQGLAGGAAINVTTKSGTNELHGSAFAYNENNALRARNFFNPNEDTPKSIRNIDGATIGGPIIKNKLFYFGGYEGTFERIGFDRLHTVATPDQREGNFSAFDTVIYDPLTGNPDGTGRQPFPNNIIPESRQSAITREMQSLVPLPNQPGTNANFFNSSTQELDRNNFDLKIDWHRKPEHLIWGKYSAMDAEVNCDFGLGEAGGRGLCNGGPGTGETLVQSSTIGQTYTFSPNFLWDSTYSWTRMGQEVRGPDFGENFGSEVLGIPGTNGPDIRQSGKPSFTISGFETLGNPNSWSPLFRNDQTFATTQNFSYLKGNHDIRFGFEGLRHHLNHWQPEIGGGPRGQFNFGQGVTGLSGGPATTQFNSYAAFLLGMPTTSEKSLQFEKMTAFEYQMGFYVRDRWQMTPRLTATLGLRYELFPLMSRAGRGGIELFDPGTNQVLLGGVGGNPDDLGISTSKTMFAPRVGLAYRLTDNTVIRSGYGITYNPMPLARPLRGFFPLTIANEFVGPNSFTPVSSIQEGIPAFDIPDVSSGSIPLPPTADMRTITGDELERGYVQSWNFMIERELPYEFFASVGYVGTQTVNQFADINANAGVPGMGTAGQPFFQRFGRNANTRFWNGQFSSNYHALQVSVKRAVGDGLTLKGAYTYSRAINMTDDDGWAGLMFNTPDQISRNRAQAGFNIPHMFKLGYVYDLPFGQGKPFANSGWQRWLFGDWQVNGFFTAAGGRPFTVFADGSALNAPGNAQTADLVKSDVERIGTVAEYFDSSAFAPVNEARFGNTGRNILRGPNLINLDLGVFRDFPLSERFHLQFRAEAFNVSNTPHFSNPNANVSSADFMRITSAQQDQRQFRFGLRLGW